MSSNRIKFGCNLLKSKLRNESVPFLLQFSVTNRCNMQCRYCYAKYYERGQEDLPFEKISAVIDEAAALGTIRINLVGGEPLLRQDVGRIIAYVKQKGIECALTSNGWLVKDKIKDVAKLDMLCLSLDGDKRANDYNRGEGSFDKVMEAIEAAATNNIKIQVASVLSSESIKSMDYLIDLAVKKNFKVGFTTPITQTYAGETAAILDMPDDEALRQAIKKILDIKKAGGPILFSKESYRFALKWPYGYNVNKIMGKRPGFKFPRCYAGRFWAIIDVNGDVYPCPSLVGVVKPLNCFQEGLKKAFEHLKGHECRTCHIPCQNEFNFMFSLNPSVLMNILKNYRA